MLISMVQSVLAETFKNNMFLTTFIFDIFHIFAFFIFWGRRHEALAFIFYMFICTNFEALYVNIYDT